MADITLHFDFRLGQRSLRWLMAACMVLAAAPEVASESVTLTTYYPAPSGVYTKMITTGDTYLARDGGRVGIGTTGPGFELEVNGPAGNWAERFVSGGAMAYFAHSSGYGAYIDAGSSAGSGTYALDVNKQGTPYLFVRGDGNVGIGTAGPAQKLDVAGAEANYGTLPHYSNWAAYGTGDGGAAIYNDAGSYQTLMIVGNNSAGGARQVGIWDKLTVNGDSYVTGAAGVATVLVNYQPNCYDVQTSYPTNGGGVTTLCSGANYVTTMDGVMSKVVQIGDSSNPNVVVRCCPCNGSCPALP